MSVSVAGLLVGGSFLVLLVLIGAALVAASRADDAYDEALTEFLRLPEPPVEERADTLAREWVA